MQLLDGNILGMTLLRANGLGPQATSAPVQSIPFTGFSSPGDVAVDAAGNVYIADSYNSHVVKETLSNGVYTQSTFERVSR